MSDAINFVKESFGKKIRVSLSDGRLVEGELACLDGSKNLVLEGAVEFYGVKEDQYTAAAFDDSFISRNLGSAIVPGQHVKKIFLLN